MLERMHLGSSALALMAGVFAASPVHAQQGQGVQEIIVTAQKRSENLQDVPIAVAAITAETATALGVQDTTDLQFTTPGLVMHRSGYSMAPILRGISTQGGGSAQVESPIAVYIDGVYQVAPSAGVFSLNNIDRIEVLKGPQGTLFGRNAVGGVISVVTADPSPTPEVRVTAGYGNYDTYEASFYGTAGLTDGVAVDLSASWTKRYDGFGEHVAAPGQVNPDEGKDTYLMDSLAVRNKWLFTPGDTTRIVVAFDYFKGEDARGTARSLLPGTYAAQNIIPNDVGLVGSIWDLRSDQYKQTAWYKNYGGAITLDQELGGVNLRSITAYRRTYVNVSGDQDSVERPVFNAFSPTTTRQFSEELQLTSSDSSRIKWIIGAYYLHVDYKLYSFYTGSLFGGTGDETWRLQPTFPTTTSVAGFGEVTIPLDADERTKVTAGIRYTSDKQVMEGYCVNQAGASCYIVDRKSTTFSDPSWRVAINHEFTPDLMAYISYNRGFQSGYYSATSPADPPVRPMTLDAYEIGFKSQLLDNRLRLNAAAFYYDAKDIQLQVFSPTGTSLLLLNAASGEAKGFDLDVEAVPVDNLTLRVGVGYIDAEYKDFPNAPVATPNPFGVGGASTTRMDVSGTDFVYTPDWTFNASILYTIPTSFGDITPAVNYYNQSSHLPYFDSFKQPGYDLWNASLAWTSPDDRWSVRFWGKNLGNEKYYNHISIGGRRVGGSPGDPRTYGVTLGMKWGG